jgi:hypothetical protein
MRTEHDNRAGVDWAVALNGILELLVAEREQRGNRCGRRTELILAGVGLSDDQIAALMGSDARNVRAVIDAGATEIPATAGGHSVIDRARATLAERSRAR